MGLGVVYVTYICSSARLLHTTCVDGKVAVQVFELPASLASVERALDKFD